LPARMIPMGRQPNAPKLTSKGTFECWHPGVKRRINLGVTDYAEAIRIQAGFYGAAVQPEVPSVASPSVPSELGDTPIHQYPGGGDAPVSILDFDAAEKPLDASDLLSNWA